jgi:hypothetical protein
MATAPVRRLDPNGDFTFGRGKGDYLAGKEATYQRLVSRLRLITGEWFLDTTAGVPWLPQDGSDVAPILGVKPNLPYVEAVLTDAVLGTDGVDSLESPIVMEFDHNTRSMSVAFEANTTDGVLEFSEVLP